MAVSDKDAQAENAAICCFPPSCGAAARVDPKRAAEASTSLLPGLRWWSSLRSQRNLDMMQCGIVRLMKL